MGSKSSSPFRATLKAPSCIHVNETGTIGRLNASGLLGPDLLVIHGNLITNGELELMAKARMPLCFTPTADTQGTPADVVRRAIDRGVEVVFGCDIPCSIASDPIGQLRVMFNVQGFLDGAMERSFSTVVGRRPPVRPGLPLADAAPAARNRDHRHGARAGPRRPDRLAGARQAGATSC